MGGGEEGRYGHGWSDPGLVFVSSMLTLSISVTVFEQMGFCIESGGWDVTRRMTVVKFAGRHKKVRGGREAISTKSTIRKSFFRVNMANHISRR